MKVIKYFTLSLAIVVLSGCLFESQAQGIINNFVNNSYNQQSKAELDKSDSTAVTPADKYITGFWIHFGLGISNMSSSSSYIPDDFYALKGGVNFKHNNYMLSFGIDNSSSDSWSISTYWTAIGLSTYSTNWDASISVGPSYLKWKWYTEGHENPIIYSPGSVGLIIQPQFLFHMKKGVGIGTVFTINISQEVQYNSITIVFVFGNWNKNK